MKTLSIWVIAGLISYLCTFWITSMVWNLVIGTIIFYLASHYIKKWLRGEI